MNRKIFFDQNPQPVCVGTGLVALDIVFNGEASMPPRMWAGGSCGNVLTILSYLGWLTIPLIRLGQDDAADRILKDWQKFDVDCNFVDLDKKVATPIIVEQIRNSVDGFPTHRFFCICPSCGTWLPRYRPVLLANAKRSFSQLSTVNCFYFDRVSPAAFALASQAKSAGALVVFEPPNIKDKDLFYKAVKISHIVKYANDRTCGDVTFNTNDGPLLVIETLGEAGIRYRFRNKKSPEHWKKLPAFSLNEFRDAAGSGDWCTAGIIYKLGTIGSKRFEKLSEKKIVEALEFGQAMAALNCGYEGARGGMYVLDIHDFKKAIKRILESRIVDEPIKEKVPEDVSALFSCLCPGCQKRERKPEGKKKLNKINSFTYHVLYKKNGVWSVIKEKDRRATSNHSTKKAAIEDAKRIAKAVSANVIVVIHKKNGAVQAEYNYRNESAQG